MDSLGLTRRAKATKLDKAVNCASKTPNAMSAISDSGTAAQTVVAGFKMILFSATGFVMCNVYRISARCVSNTQELETPHEARYCMSDASMYTLKELPPKTALLNREKLNN